MNFVELLFFSLNATLKVLPLITLAFLWHLSLLQTVRNLYQSGKKMRFTGRLCAQHLGWMFKKHWRIQGKRTPTDTGAASELAKFGIEVKDIKEVAYPKKQYERIDIEPLIPVEPPHDETHPNWHPKKCYIYGNSNVLLEGIKQAQILTKTVEIKSLPQHLKESTKKLSLFNNVDRNVCNSIMASHVFDAEQVKLPKVKLPDRPRYNLPRVFGISHERRNRLLINKLLAECEKYDGHSLTSRRRLLDYVDFKITLPRNDDLLQFHITGEKFITADRPIELIKEQCNGDLPDIYPIKCTITLPKKNIYTTETFYPLSTNIKCTHPHTIITFFNKEYVGHLHETQVSTTQFQSRTMLKAFTVAATRAKQLYGESALEKIPQPIVVQGIQTDGRVFHFSVYQLNTLRLGDEGDIKNYWFHEDNIEMFEECGYKAGRPYLDGYNKDAFRILNAFYHNV